jgi:two-component system response regulator (stage 0 sporulation protein F)
MKKLLIVDDEPDVEMLYKQKFRKEVKEGICQLFFENNGHSALEFMSRLDPFDLVLLLSDINMPGMTGLELLEQTRIRFPHLQVIMVTAYGDPLTRKKVDEMGASGLISKPVDFDELKKVVFT